MDRRLRYASGATPLNSSAPRVQPPPVPLTRSYSSNAKLYGNTSGTASEFSAGNEATRQMERYCETLETDHAELRSAFNEQNDTVTSLTALLRENKFKDSAVRSLENKLGQYEAFVAELHNLVTDGRGLRPRLNPNQPSISAAKSLAATNAAAAGAVPSLDTVRQAVQQSQLRLRELTTREAKQAAALKQLEAERKTQPRAVATTTHTADDAAADPALMHTPASTKEMVNLRQKVLSLEQRLFNAERDARSLTVQLQKRDDATQAAVKSAEARAQELATLKDDLTLREKLLDDVRGRCLSAERRLAHVTRGDEPEGDTTSNSKGGPMVRSSVSHLLHGAGYARAVQWLPADTVEAAVTDALSRALHVPAANLSQVAVRPSKDGAVVDCTVRHAASPSGATSTLNADALQTLLLAYPFTELEPLKEAAAAAVEAELTDVRTTLETRVRESAAMQRQVRELEGTVERLHRARSTQDAEVNNVIEDTAATVRALHTALKSAQQDNADLRTAHAAEHARTMDLEARLKAEQAALGAAQQAIAAAQSATRALDGKVKQLTADKAACEHKMSALIATHAEETAAMEHAQHARDTTRSQETNDRLHALEAALREATAEGQTLRTRASDAEKQREEAQAARDECEAKLKAVTTETTQAERSLDTALLRKGNNAGRRSSSSANSASLVSKVRAVCLELSRVDKDVLEAKAELEREREVAQQAQAQALEAITKASSQSAATLQAELADVRTQLRAQEQRADKAERVLASEVAALKEAAKSAEDAHKSDARTQRSNAETQLKQLQSQLATVQGAARRTQEEMEMKIVALEGLLEAEREQREEEKKKQDPSTATAAVSAASRELQREIRGLKRDKDSLTEQVGELETDLSDFARMREELQTSLDMAEKQLRAKTHDFDLLVKQLLRLEETERALKEENDSLRGSLAASPRGDVEPSGVAVAATAGEDATPGKSGPSTGLNAPSRLTPRRGLKSPKGTAAPLKNSPVSPVVVAQSRVLKRNTSATSFSRTASQATPAAAASVHASPDKRSPDAGAACAPQTSSRVSRTSVVKSVRPDTQQKQQPQAQPQPQPQPRSRTPTASSTTAASAAGKTTATTTTFEAPPRLNDFHRQGSNRGYFTTVQQQLQQQQQHDSSVTANGRASAEEERPASSTRRRPSSPIASVVMQRTSRGSGEAVLKRQLSSTDPVATNGVFKRTPSSFLAAAAGNSASFVRTPSGYRRVQQ